MTIEEIRKICQESNDREDLLCKILLSTEAKKAVEVGVYEGDLSRYLLQNCAALESYVLVDPWSNLEDWNKPYNQSNEAFEKIYQRMLEKLDFAKDKVQILRGRTQEVSQNVNSDSVDFIYIDGDHTLRGITVDLLQWSEKLKGDGILVGDDFYPSMKRKSLKYEPTMVFPYAIHFAEAVDVKIYALPFNQFLIDNSHKGFEFIDLTGRYSQIEMKPLLKELILAQNKSSILKKLSSRIKGLLR